MVKINKKKKIVITPKPIKKIKQKKPKNGVNKDTANHNLSSVPKQTSVSSFIKEPSNLLIYDSVTEGESLFENLISPTTVVDFMSKTWEKEPLLIKRKNNGFYKDLLSSTDIDHMVCDQYVEYTKNIDITSYKNGKRETLNPEGRVMRSDLWSFYNEGCSIRILNPQTFLPNICKLNSILQEYFHCMVGSNIYLTPPNSQGFAPHYDDIEAFVLQIEGEKHWKLYKPRSEAEVLPRESSRNFQQNEIGSPILEVTLKAGDILYFPRGTIHQARAINDMHSLHITLSVYQKNSWADLLELLLPDALKLAVQSDVSLRRGLPLDIHRCMGVIHSDSESPSRAEYIKTLRKMVNKIFASAPLDIAVDLMCKKFHEDALPPVLNAEEIKRSVFGKEKIVPMSDGRLQIKNNKIKQSTKVRLVRAHIIRLIFEENTYRIYYHCDNSRQYHEHELTYLDVDDDCAPIINMIIESYPEFIAVSDLKSDDPDFALPIVQELWNHGILITEDVI